MKIVKEKLDSWHKPPIHYEKEVKNMALKNFDKKVLIAAPIGGTKQYSINDWFNWILNQKYPNHLVEVCICTNGSENRKLADLIKQVIISYPDGSIKHITTLELPNSTEMTTIQKITYSREMIRRYAVQHCFEYIFFLDTDTIPAYTDAITQLMMKEKDVISGLYFYKATKQPVIIDKLTNTNISLQKCQELALANEICEVWGFGFGCLLISRNAFEKCAFDYELFGEERTDDFGYCHVLESKGIKRYFSPAIICKHLSDPSAVSTEGTKLPFQINPERLIKPKNN